MRSEANKRNPITLHAPHLKRCFTGKKKPDVSAELFPTRWLASFHREDNESLERTGSLPCSAF
jgi:hypothetical protein